MRINKVVAAIVGAVVLLALCVGVSLAVVNSTNNHNQAAQRAAATASHNRAVASASAAANARAIAAANAKVARAEAAASAAAKAANRLTPPAPVIVQPAPVVQVGLTACGSGTQGEEVYAGANTSCPFALNVESDYAAGGYWNQSGTSQFYSYSPVTGQTYLMTSSSVGNPVVVTGGNNTLVQFDY